MQLDPVISSVANFQNCETTILRCFELPLLRKKLTVKNVNLDGTLNSNDAEYAAHIKANDLHLKKEIMLSKENDYKNHILN